MKRRVLNLILIALACMGSSAFAQVYVNASATGSNDGTSWANAYTDLQQAIYDATSGDEIWVAQASYVPTIDETGALPANLRLRHFWLKDGVEVYGGFIGTETEFNQRNVQTQKATLEGQVDPTNQAFHVINTTAGNTALLDGFIVQNGNTTGGSGAGSSELGAGLLMNGSARFSNIDFLNNNAYNSGGGAFIINANTTLINCRFDGNTTTLYDGAGLYSQNSTITLYNCIFYDNNATRFGAALTAVSSTVNLQNASVANNIGTNVYQASTNGIINNNQSLLWGNTATIGIDTGGGSAVNFTECIYQWTAAGSNVNADPLFVNIATGDLHLSAASPAIDGVSSTPFTPYRDMDGNHRIAGSALDQGAYEYGSVQGLILYVDTDATGANNGSSWTDAFNTLEDALAAGSFYQTEEIWIAEGTYTPHASDRFAYWDLKTGTKIYGGFDATETLRSQRDPSTHVVRLSGDLNGNDNTNLDPTEATRQDNSYHLFRALGQKSNMIIDGVTLADANANGTGNELTAGVFISFHNGSDQLIQLSCNDVIVEKNTATSAAIYQNFHFASQGGTTILNFSHSVIRENVGGSIHGNMRYEGDRNDNQKNYGTIDNCLFYDNANTSASGVSTISNQVYNGFSVVCPMVVTNNTFTENNGGNGYLINVTRSGDSRYVNNIIWNNGTPNPIFHVNSGSPTLTFVNNICNESTFGLDQDPLFRDAPNDDFRIACSGGSPAINGGTSLINPIAEFDFAGLARTAEGTVDIGAHEFQAGLEIVASKTMACPGESITLTASGGTSLSWTGGITNGTPFIPSSTTTYTASGNTVNNCLESEDITITVISVNDYAVSSPSTTLCSSGSATVNIAGSENGVLYSLLEDGTSNVLDGPTAGTGGALSFNTGTLSSTTTVNVTAQKITSTNFAYDFDGSNDYVSLGNSNRGITGNVTVSARVRLNPTGASQWVAAKYSGTNGFVLFVDAAGKPKIDGRDGAGGYKSSGVGSTVITDGQWHEITGVVNNTGWFIYVDGVLESSTAYTPGGVLGSAVNFNVGAQSGMFSPVDIDQLTIWNIGLDAATILNNLNTCFTGSESNVVGHFDFNEASGTAVIDHSASATNGIIYGGYDPATSSVNGSINGCTEMCETVMDLPITITIGDNVAPTADVATLSDVTSACAVSSLTAPTATDNCVGSITGTHNATFPITANTTVTWTYDDGNGNTSTQTQTVVINDNVPPVADLATLSDLTDQCQITSLTPPTATDNCNGAITGTTGISLPITASTTITWSYDDGNGNIATQTQNVIINDNTAPVADIASLSSLTAQCEITSLTAPTATDNCNGTITGTHNVTLPLTASTTITWTYDDGNGNTSTQNQVVTINDNTAPVADIASLSMLTAQCEITSLTAPTATDNCTGALTGTHNATLPITSSTTITWTYDDGNGNTTTQNQTVTINDNTAPVVDVTSLSDLTAQCEITSLSAPTATDNCNGAITGTHNASLPITGSTTITWTYDDGNGNTSTQTQNVVINDNTAPVADIASLNDLSAQCSISTLTAPSATDNCAGALVGSHNASLPITASTTIVWTYDDGNGNTTTQNQNVIINDNTAPVADLGVLSDITSQCAVTSLSAPTATDNCSGSVNGVHNATFPITANTTITWTYTDGSGNASTQTQNVIVNDNTAPVPDIASLPAVNAECSISSLVAPSATDNCSGALTGSHNASFPITSNTTVTWTYDDGNGNTTTQTQSIIIDDVTAPVADVTSLPDVTAQCEVTSLSAPTATDNCAGTITGTHNASLPITATTVVTWTYDDGDGNVSTQTQNVVINDNTAPVADAGALTDLTAACEITTLTAPTATDNCNGSITGTPDVTVPITSSTTITWTYDDGNGNTSTQTQNVIINDNVAPVEDVATLADITDQCEITSLIAPTATDNCAGTITGAHNVSLPITVSTTITWTYDDGNGNTTTQTQQVIISDITAPVPDVASLNDITEVCEVTTLTPPTATDNCVGTIAGTHNATLPITSNTTVTWTYDDGNGNTVTQDQQVIITPVDATTSVSGITITANTAGADGYQWVDCNNGNAPIVGETGQSFTPTANGSYAVEVTMGNCTETSNCETISTIGLDELNSLDVVIYPNPTRDLLNIDTDLAIRAIEIYDVTGKHVRTEMSDSFSVQNLAPGTYTLSIETEQGAIKKRFVKQQ